MISTGRMEIILDMVATDKSENFEDNVTRSQDSRLPLLRKKVNSCFRKKA